MFKISGVELEREKMMSVLKRGECLVLLGVFLVVEREISASGEKEGWEGRSEEGRERCLVFNSKQVADVICYLFNCASFLIIFF